MKPADCICKIDKLGRVLIPKNLRTKLDLQVDDALEIFTDDDAVILKKYHERCVFCGAQDDLVSFRDKSVCRSCAEALSRSV